MSAGIRILLIFISILTMLFMLRKIRQSKLQIEYGVFWIAFAILLILLSVFPTAVEFLTDLMGFQAPVNFVFLFIIFILILKVFFMTLELSQLENRVKELAQKMAVDKKIEEEDCSREKENKE